MKLVMYMKKKKVIIIGAGPAGLSAAYELLKDNKHYDVIIIEENNQVGGISKTIKYHGNRMDLGGHRFFTKIDRVNDYWNEVMPIQGKKSKDDKILNIDKNLNINGPDPEKTTHVRLVRHRVSRIYYLKKFFDYPISLKKSTIKSLGIKNTIICGFSYLKSIFIKKKEDSLENFYINRFGKKLYSMFFEKYTEKLWGRHPKDISAEWGAQRVKGLSIIGVITNALRINKKKETSLIDEFTYPKYGPGSLWEKVAEEIENKGGTILLNNKVEKINIKDNKIISVECNNRIIDGDIFISSMPIKDLIESINGNVPKKVKTTAENLPYRDFVTIGLLVKKLNIKNETNIKTINNIVPDCWIYVQEDNIKMGRIQIFNNWSPYMVKDYENTVWIGLEYFCNENDDFWNKKDKDLKNLAVKELISMGIINEKNILDYHVEKIKKAYPAYFDTYKDIDIVRKYINKFDNLYCIGRNGQHRYNNMDHSVMTGFLTADHIQNKIKSKDEIWNVNTEEEYHEEKIVEKKKEKKNKNILNLILFIIFVSFTLYMALNHEAWRDEAQSFLLSRDLSIISLIKNAPQEGHPVLYHILIKILVGSGLNYTKLSITSWIFTLIGACIIIWKFPGKTIYKILILLTYPLIYFCPMFARSYALALPIFITISYLYSIRYKNYIIYSILIILICNIHLLYAGFIGILLFIEIYDYLRNKDYKKEKIIIIISSIIGLLLFLLQLYGANGSYFKRTIDIETIIVTMLSYGLSLNNYIIGLIVNICILIITYQIYKTKEYKILFIYIFTYLLLIAIQVISGKSTYLSQQYILILLFTYWNIKDKSKINKMFIIILLLQIPFTYSCLKAIIKYPLTDSKNIAKYIEKNIPKNNKLYCSDPAACSAIIPYLNSNYKFIDSYTNKEFTYIKWPEYYKYDREKIYNKNKSKYIIISRDINIDKLKDYKIIYESPNTLEPDESYYLLERKDYE